jgi:hypothetical protein
MLISKKIWGKFFAKIAYKVVGVVIGWIVLDLDLRILGWLMYKKCRFKKIWGKIFGKIAYKDGGVMVWWVVGMV